MEKKPKHFLKQPEYPGGPKAMSKFIYENLRYPKQALEAGKEGVVLVEYDINHEGLVMDTRVLQSVGYGCDEEAERVIRLLKFEVGKNRGIKVVFHKKTQIQFKKPVAIAQPKPVAAPPMAITYQYVTAAPPKPTVEAPKKEQVFSYSITYDGK
jgi:protein TonB